MEEIRWCDTHADWAADHLGGVPEDVSRCRWSRFVNSEKPCEIRKVLHIPKVNYDRADDVARELGVPEDVAEAIVEAAVGSR